MCVCGWGWGGKTSSTLPRLPEAETLPPVKGTIQNESRLPIAHADRSAAITSQPNRRRGSKKLHTFQIVLQQLRFLQGPGRPLSQQPLTSLQGHHHHHHLSLNREGRWSTTDDFVTSFLHFFPLFSTALWDLANSRPVHSLMMSSHLFLCLPRLLPPLW